MTTFIFVRHGESETNKTRQFDGNKVMFQLLSYDDYLEEKTYLPGII